MCGNKRDGKQAFIRRLATAGCPIDVDPGPEELTILQKGEAHIMDMGNGHVGIVLWMMLIRDKPGQIVVEEFGDLFLPWDALSVTWLDPLSKSSRTAVYELPNGFSLGRDLVLNDKLGESGVRLRPGHHVEGYVLGYTKSTIPKTYHHGALLHAQFSVIDVVDREHRGDVVFFVDRMAGRIPSSAVRPGTGLFEPCDPPGVLIADQSVSARQRLGDPVQRQDNAVAEAKVLRNLERASSAPAWDPMVCLTQFVTRTATSTLVPPIRGKLARCGSLGCRVEFHTAGQDACGEPTP